MSNFAATAVFPHIRGSSSTAQDPGASLCRVYPAQGPGHQDVLSHRQYGCHKKRSFTLPVSGAIAYEGDTNATNLKEFGKTMSAGKAAPMPLK